MQKLSSREKYSYVIGAYGKDLECELWGMTYTIMDIPYWSMIPTLATIKEDREKISVVPRIFASLGGLTVTTFGLTLVNKFRNGDQLKGFEYFALGIILVYNLAMQLACGIAIYYFKYVASKENLFSVYSFFKVAEIGGFMLFPMVTRKNWKTAGI